MKSRKKLIEYIECIETVKEALYRELYRLYPEARKKMNEKIDLKEETTKRGFDCNLPNKKCEECSSIDNCRWLIKNVRIEEKK